MSHAAKSLLFEVQNIKVLSQPGMVEHYPAHLESANRLALYWARHLIAGTY
jgi:hypothetical protein